jgi:transcriptional antiterminator
MSGDFTSYTQKPDVEKFYTVAELAEYFNVTCDTIRNISNRMALPHDYITKNRARLAVYPYESLKIIQEHFDAREKLRKLAEEFVAFKEFFIFFAILTPQAEAVNAEQVVILKV